MRPSSEALLVSSLVNNKDTSLGDTHGVDPDMLVGYQAEYRWVQSFGQTYGSTPSKDALLTRFPDFPFTDATDAAFAADEVRQGASQRSLRTAVRQAAMFISEGDYLEAEMALSSYVPLPAVKPPQNMLYDLSFLQRYDEKPDVLEVPWRTLQAVTGGIRPGDLWYQAARLGQGKSWLALEAAAYALEKGRRVNIWSLEMSKEQLLTRLHVVLGRRLGIPVDHKQMRDRVYDVIAYRKLVNRIRDEVPGEIFVYDSRDGVCSPSTVNARAGEADLNIIDYIDLMTSPLGRSTAEDWRVLAAISNELKRVAVAKETRIWALAQINREGDTPSKYPAKSKNLSGSDHLGRDGDVVLIHKKWSKTSNVYNIDKNRHGDSEVLYYSRFLPNEGAFHEISRDTADDLRDREGIE